MQLDPARALDHLPQHHVRSFPPQDHRRIFRPVLLPPRRREREQVGPGIPFAGLTLHFRNERREERLEEIPPMAEARAVLRHRVKNPARDARSQARVRIGEYYHILRPALGNGQREHVIEERQPVRITDLRGIAPKMLPKNIEVFPPPACRLARPGRLRDPDAPLVICRQPQAGIVPGIDMNDT